jgi:ribosomal protein L11 methylase PrmA
LATRTGQLIGGQERDPGILRDEAPEATWVIEHPRLDFISHPYEWSFSGLQAAALLTLDLHLEALRHDLTLSDASAYNVQFEGIRPVFIDYLSMIPYQAGQVWLGYRQFCEQFLNPLLLTARTGVSFQPLYRGNLEGIRPSDLAALLPLRAKLNPLVALHVVLQARAQSGVTARRTRMAKRVKLSRTGLTNSLQSMRRWVASFAPPASQRSPWQHYEQSAQYSEEERAAKRRFVHDAVKAVSSKTVWDLGCNSGEYSEIALVAGAGSVIGFEPDPGALEAAFRRAQAKQLRFLPLSVDLANPTPSMGWREHERRGLHDRRGADLVLCLALIHHLVLGRNIPLSEAIEWVVSLAPRGIIEFVPKEDPKAAELLALKPDIAPDYEPGAFRALLQRHARMEREERVTASGRTLFLFSRV